MRYKGKVAKEFIVRRDERVAKDEREQLDPYFQWDCEFVEWHQAKVDPFQTLYDCLLYTSPSPRDRQKSRMPSSA